MTVYGQIWVFKSCASAISPHRHGEPFQPAAGYAPRLIRKSAIKRWNNANARFHQLSNPGHRRLELAGLTIARPESLIRKDLA